jgi:hypothetical protein
MLFLMMMIMLRCHPQLLPSPWSPCSGLQQQGLHLHLYILHSFVLLMLLHYHHVEAHAPIVLVEGGWDNCLMFLLFHYFTCQSIDDRFIAFSN